MPIQTDLARFDAPILLIQPLKHPLIGVITADNQIHLYNTQTGEKEKLIRLNVPEEKALFYAFNPDRMELLFGSENSNKLHLISLKTKKIINRFELDQQSPTAIAFAPDGRHFICGTDQGRVLLWCRDANTLIARLHSFPEYTSLYTKPKINFISAVTFHESELATTGYGGGIVITDYATQSQTKWLHTGNLKKTALLFYKNSLIAGNQDGTLLKIDRNGKHPNQRLITPLGAITRLLRIGPEPYVLAASERNTVALIDAESMRMIHETYITLDHPLTSMCSVKDQLYVATTEGVLASFDLEPLDHLTALINAKEYGEAYRYCEQEPLLLESQPYQTLEKIFLQMKTKAVEALEKGDTAAAKTILQPFNPAKSKETAAIMTSFSQMERLEYLFIQQKFSPFYGLIEQYPLLKLTQRYQQIEKLWSAQFIKAQKLMLIGRAKEAQTELIPFATVNAKRPFIQLLLHHLDVFKLYSKAVHERNFARLSQLTGKHPVLRQLPSYIQLIEEAGELSSAIIDALQSARFDEANLLLDELSSITKYESDYRRLKHFTSSASLLHRAITKLQWRSAYQLLDSMPELAILDWAQEIETKWHQIIQRCETHAIRADIPSIKQELGNLITLPNRHQRIGDIFRTAYQIQLKKMIQNTPEKFSAAVEHYCEFFGMDTELQQLIKTASRQKVHPLPDPLKLQPKKRDEWLSYIGQLPEFLT